MLALTIAAHQRRAIPEITPRRARNQPLAECPATKAPEEKDARAAVLGHAAAEMSRPPTLLAFPYTMRHIGA